jgi:restriction system protein
MMQLIRVTLCALGLNQQKYNSRLLTLFAVSPNEILVSAKSYSVKERTYSRFDRAISARMLQTHVPKPAKRNAVQLPSFKMSDKSLFAVLLRSPWWISFALAVAVGAACFKLFPDRFAIVGALSGLPFAVIGGMAMWKQRGIPSPARVEEALQKLSALSARDFAGALEAAYAKDGYAVSKITARGADLSVTKAGRTALVNSKRWKAATHGIEPMRELSATMAALDANQGVYIALNAPTDAARAFAAKNSIRVMQGTELALLMRPVTAVGKRTA